MSRTGQNFISWVNSCVKAASTAVFYHCCDLDGAVDGCHIRVQRPPKRGGDCMKQKAFYSVLLHRHLLWATRQAVLPAGGTLPCTGQAFLLIFTPKHDNGKLTVADYQ